MEIVKTGSSGTLESGDIFIEIEQGPGIEIDLSSTVKSLYGRQIEQVIRQTLAEMGVKNAKIVANDKGALDCTIASRVKTAVMRGAQSQDYNFSTEGRRR